VSGSDAVGARATGSAGIGSTASGPGRAGHAAASSADASHAGTSRAGSSHADANPTRPSGTSSPGPAPHQSQHSKARTGALAPFPDGGGLSLTTTQLAGLVTATVVLGALVASLVIAFMRRRFNPYRNV
jgi:hypothetical protein